MTKLYLLEEKKDRVFYVKMVSHFHIHRRNIQLSFNLYAHFTLFISLKSLKRQVEICILTMS